MPGESAWPTSYDYNWCENTAQGQTKTGPQVTRASATVQYYCPFIPLILCKLVIHAILQTISVGIGWCASHTSSSIMVPPKVSERHDFYL